jgi:hypothetical protein
MIKLRQLFHVHDDVLLRRAKVHIQLFREIEKELAKRDREPELMNQ